MSRSGRLFLQDMLECARKVVRYTTHLTREQFFPSELEYVVGLRLPSPPVSPSPASRERGTQGVRATKKCAYSARREPTRSTFTNPVPYSLASAPPTECPSV